ncbi:hypothetical protein GCM10010399_88500 [Dactylosporangium fulvum]
MVAGGAAVTVAEAAPAIRAGHPAVAVLVVTVLDDDDSVYGALRAGASGYLLKSASPGGDRARYPRRRQR